MFENADLIHRYSRAQAIEDGVLVDVTATAREAGIRYPTALTAAVWQRYVRVPAGVEAQDEAGRLWDIVWMMRWAIRAAKADLTAFHFRLHVRNTNGRPELVTLKVLCGPGDDAAPVLTVLLPDED
jgi:hypothetical protein